jgi:hypothetical protein
MRNHCFITGNCMLCCFNSEFTNKYNKITNKTNKKPTIFLSVLCVILLIFFVNYLLKQHSTQLSAIKSVISHEIFQLADFDRVYVDPEIMKKRLAVYSIEQLFRIFSNTLVYKATNYYLSFNLNYF